MRVFIVNSNHQYDELFRGMGHSIVSTIDFAEMLCFTGGADVTPEIYGDKAHTFTGYDRHRDEYEFKLFNRALELDLPMVGICRGAQFLNVMNGGRMYQHVSKHTAPHEIIDLQTGETVLVSSTHHQMMMMAPNGLLVASSALGGTREWYDGEIARKDVSDEDIEVVYYEDSNCLCFQPHPEFPSFEYEPMRDYFERLINKFLVWKSVS
jgi:gamma-glutamyl-gamma-aminobutyrate hydrolase PuuD